MILQANVLSSEEKNRIHEQSLKILRDIGVRFHSMKALELLSDNGAIVDKETKIAKIPSAMVEKALKTAPKTFVLGARNPEFDVCLPTRITGFTLDGTAIYVRDFESGERRYATLKDLMKSALIFEQMDMGIIAWPPTCASDAPANSRVLHEFFTMLKYTSKHVQHELQKIEQVPYLLAAMEEIQGSADEIRRRPICSVTYCTIAPLVHDEKMCEAYLELVNWGIPILIYPMPAAGSTGPASLFSNLTLANAEALSALVLFQTAKPNSPQLFGNASGSIDFFSGEFLEGTPEMVLQTMGMGEMAKFYGLPGCFAGCLTDAKEPGSQAVLEKTLTTLPLILGEVDIIQGIGEIEASKTLVFEQIIIDNEIAHLCHRLKAGIDCSTEKDLFSDIEAAGPGGHFLKSRNTRQAARSREFYQSKLLERSHYDAWINMGQPRMYTKARETVQDIFNQPMHHSLSEKAISKLNTLLSDADRNL